MNRGGLPGIALIAGSLLLLEVAAETAIKEWTVSRRAFFLAGGVAAYVLVAFALAYSLLRVPQLSIVNAVWQTSNLVILSVLGVLVYKEKLSERQKLGIALAVIASVLLMVDR